MGFWDWLNGWLEWLGLKNKNGKLVLLGLDNAGKTTLLHRLKTGKFEQFEQTKSYHREDLVMAGIRFSAYDLGGHDAARQAWSDYYCDAQAVIFMVDAANPTRFEEAREQLDALLREESLRKVPFLILGNKVDCERAVSESHLAMTMGLTSMTPLNQTTATPGQRVLRLFMCSVKTKFGYAEGIQWLAKFI
jgi:GTP-binding protein SAR1